MVIAALHRFVDQKRVREAILQAEELTSAPISVSIVASPREGVHAAALRALHEHGLTASGERNAVHFFVVPSRREFAVVGDAGAHARLGQSVWDSVVATVQDYFRRGDPTSGLVKGIEEVAQHLARHFPRSSTAAENRAARRSC